MKSLYEAIKESLLDAEDTDYTPHLVAKAWANKHMEGEDYEVADDGNIPTCDICILRPHHIAKDFFDK